MKYIEKGDEPPELLEWKSADKMYQRGRPKWNRLRPPAKTAVHTALIDEQGGICCYCGTGVSLNSSHIEHFRPQKNFPEMQLDYYNMLCSCQKELQKSEPRHCGNAKGQWYEEGVTVSPLSTECEARFEYLEDGRIRPVANNHRASETIARLNLDAEKLRELRKAAIDAALIDIESLQDEYLQESIAVYAQRSSTTNRFQPFCMAIVQTLESLLG